MTDMTEQSPVRVLYEARQLPIFQNRMHETAEEARTCPQGDLLLVEDLQSGLVFNQAFQPERMQYDRRYQNEQALSPRFLAHLETVGDIVERSLGRRSLVEVGCGKGFFLEMLLARGAEMTGFDPAYEGANPAIVRKSFVSDLDIPARGIVLRHVLEHIQDPIDFLMRIRATNGGHGRIYIEVPCFDWILRQRAWFDVFYEHVNYFRLSDFQRMFGGIHESGYLFGGQYLYVVADLASLEIPRYDASNPVRFPSDFMKRLVHSGQDRTAIWGGASKGVIFALFRERLGAPIHLVIDINPAKQGKYLPGTGLRVYSPRDGLALLPPGSSMYVMNSNYLNEIRGMSNDAYHYIGIDHD